MQQRVALESKAHSGVNTKTRGKHWYASSTVWGVCTSIVIIVVGGENASRYDKLL